MRSQRLHLITTILAAAFLFSCTRETEEFKTTPLSEYLPLQVGKYITYRLDSMVFTSFGANTEVHSYQEKNIVDAEITDAQGRKSYRIFRFLRDTAGTQPWKPSGTYFITPTDSVIEVNENNLRFIKMVLTVTLNNTWRGNRYLPNDVYGPLFSFNNDVGMDDWDYTYSSVNSSMVIKGQTFNDVLTIDVDISNPIFNANFKPAVDSASVINSNGIAQVSYLQYSYAKTIGLISERFIMWEYQPNTQAKVGFGIRRSIIDHN